MVKPYKKSVHSLSTQRVWISECVYVRVCLPVCVCRVTWGQFRYFCSILLRAKNNCQLSPLFAVAWSVCVWVCLLVNYNWWFSFSSQLGPPYPAPIICAFFSSFSAHFLTLSFPLSTTLSHYLFDCCHVRLFRCRCRCCCCSSAFFISCTQSWSKDGIIK